jgi:hypothetical protein
MSYVSLAHAQAHTELIAARLSRSQIARYHDIVKKAQVSASTPQQLYANQIMCMA